MPTLLFSVWQFLVIFTILPIESVWCAVSQHTFIREETRLRMGRECRRPGSAQEENGWTLPWWQVIFNGHCLFRPWGRGCLSCSTQLVSHGTKFYIHDHDMGGFRCKYIYFDTGPGPWTNEKVVVVKKKKKRGGGGNVGRISYLISFSRINFRGKSILYAWLFIHILLLICASPGCIRTRGKRKTC